MGACKGSKRLNNLGAGLRLSPATRETEWKDLLMYWVGLGCVQ